MRVRTPGLRWFDSEGDFPRRCDVAATHRAFVSHERGSPVEEVAPRYSSVVDASNALWAQWVEHLEVNLMLALFYPPEP